jgi:hypothetical protein
MDILKTSELLYVLKEKLSYLYLLFEGKWWVQLMKRTGVERVIGLVEQSHNELVRLRPMGININYRPFQSRERIHRLFEDPLHQCWTCQNTVRMRPNLRNRLCKKFGLKKYKNANFALVDW